MKGETPLSSSPSQNSIFVHLASQCLLNSSLVNKICLTHLKAMYGNNRHNWGSISSIISLFTGHFSINFWFGSSPIILACTHPSYNSPSASLIVMYYLEMLLTVLLCTFCLLLVAYSLPPHPVWPHLLSYLFSSLTWLFLKLTLTLGLLHLFLLHGTLFPESVLFLHQTSTHQSCHSSLPVVVRGLPGIPLSCYPCLCVILSPWGQDLWLQTNRNEDSKCRIKYHRVSLL